MAKYRKKPVEIEAMQLLLNNEEEVINFTGGYFRINTGVVLICQ